MNFPELQPELLYVIVFGPGFGESIVIRPPESTNVGWIFVDSCQDRGSVPAASLLQDQGGRRACAILTHPHQDHGMGFDEIISTPGDGFVGCTNPMVSRPETVSRSRAWAASADDVAQLHGGRLGATVRAIHARWEDDPSTRWELRRGDQKNIGPVELNVLHPDEQSTRSHPTQFNELSSPIRVHWQDLVLLLGADLPGPIWETLPEQTPNLSQHALLKVPHHGSENDISNRYADDGDRNRFWIITPYNRGSNKLPNFEPEGGMDTLLDHVDEAYLTALPLAEKTSRGPHSNKTLDELSQAPPSGPIPSVGGVSTQPLQPQLPDDKYRCFVGAGFGADGGLEDRLFGPGSLTITK